MNTRTIQLSLIAAAALLAGCAAAPTHIESTWRDPTFSAPPLDRVAVVALFDSEAESRSFETTAAAELGSLGIEAVPGHTILDSGRTYEQSEMRDALAEAGAGGILIFRLIAMDDRFVYRQPTPYLQVPRDIIRGDPYYWYYYPNWNYYWHWRSSYDVTRSPDYWAQLSYVLVESSLYDTSTDQLVWTAKSETIDGTTEFDTVAESIADTVAERLIDADLVAAGTGPMRAASRQSAANR